jgi:hypothetical protein
VQVNKSSGGKRPESLSPQGADKMPGGADGKKLIRVGVLKMVAGRYTRQEDQERLFSPDEYEKASEYYWEQKAMDGYLATWYDPLGRKPKITGTTKPWADTEGAYNRPKRDGANSDAPMRSQPAPKKTELVGTWNCGQTTMTISEGGKLAWKHPYAWRFEGTWQSGGDSSFSAELTRDDEYNGGPVTRTVTGKLDGGKLALKVQESMLGGMGQQLQFNSTETLIKDKDRSTDVRQSPR